MPPRGFGIDATTPLNVVREVARAAEQAGYDSFWLNGSPPDAAMRAVAAAAEVTSFPIGTGVLPFNRRPIDQLIEDTRALVIPQDRFLMGIGWGGGAAGALDTMRAAVERIRSELAARPLVGAFGPNMTRLAGEIADGVIFTWWFREAIEESRPLVEEGAARAGRETPPIYSYIRCALLPQAQAALDEAAGNYDSIPRFRRLFRAHGRTAHDTVVTGQSAAELRPGIEREEAILDYAIIRAITADQSAESILELLDACKPT
ncbi:MAG TPA: LLM class flavin-dependent oxidoreductase [Thermomicrobiales bacterium]|nr:LLM class flavin-dependent oxidoreductase [Thermomicrobiales bacterium]